MRLSADFQSMTHDDIVTVTFDDVLEGTAVAQVGQSVELDDLEGHTALGIVRQIDDDLLDIQVLMETWSNEILLSSGWTSSALYSTSWRADQVREVA